MTGKQWYRLSQAKTVDGSLNRMFGYQPPMPKDWFFDKKTRSYEK